MLRAKATTTRRHLERLDREEAAMVPHDHAWPPRVEDPELNETFWRDPEPDCNAVLTADRIRKYHYLVGRMIRPFQERHLNPASYDLTLGPWCLVDGEEKVLSPRNPVLRIPPGSIALVTPREQLLIPHWLVATFNLKSEYIFKGLLMGIGPQIDPGFMGALTCPLHNISCEAISLSFCEPFAKLDFIKTTWGKCADLGRVRGENDLYAKWSANRLLALDGELMKLWPREENFRAPLQAGRGSAGVQGSLGELDSEVRRFRRSLRLGGFGAAAIAIALVTAIAALGAYALIYADGRISDARRDATAAARAEVRTLMRSPDRQPRRDALP
jgi:deoxycytidine triphosphate deaminase